MVVPVNPVTTSPHSRNGDGGLRLNHPCRWIPLILLVVAGVATIAFPARPRPTPPAQTPARHSSNAIDGATRSGTWERYLRWKVTRL